MTKVELVENTLNGSRKQLYDKLKSNNSIIADESLILRDE